MDNKEVSWYMADFIFQEKSIVRVNENSYELTADEKQRVLDLID